MTAFYQRLGVSSDASVDELQAAYKQQLARLVKKLRQANKSGADTAVIETEKRALMEAHEVLVDPARRRRYDKFQELEGIDLPSEPGAFWEEVQGGMVEPGAAAAVDVVRTLTSLPVGEVFAPVSGEGRHPSPPPVSEAASPPDMSPATDPFGSVADFSDPGLTVTEPVVGPGPTPELNRAEVSPAQIEDLKESLGLDGRFLAAVRQAQGVRIEQVAEATKISPRYIEAIETNAFERLPSAIFVKGYLREIAQVLDLDANEVVEGYLALFTRERGG